MEGKWKWSNMSFFCGIVVHESAKDSNMCCVLVLKIPCLAIAIYLFYRRTVFLKHSSLFHSQASRWYFLVCKGELVALTSLFQAWYNMIQSQPYSKDTPLILAISNSDFGWISLRKTVIALCSASFTSQGKVSRTSDSIFGRKFWLVLQKTRALEQSYILRVISFWFYLNVSFQNTSIPPPRMVNGISEGLGG